MSGIKLIYDSTCTNTASTTCAWTVPAGVFRVTFEVWGGGGGGGVSGTNCNCCSTGGAGSGGGYSKYTVDTSPGTVYQVVAGSAGVSGSFGAPTSICANGITGGTSYVTGTGIPATFCATGGLGGLSDFGTNCYAYCGCNFYSRTPGQGYGGNTVAQGTWGVVSLFGDQSPYGISNFGGVAGGPGGGSGGFNISGGYCGGHGCSVTGEGPLHGRVPGGGGAGSSCWSTCQCTPWASGRGGPGMVKITY